MTTDNSTVAKRRNPCCLRKAHRRILGGPKASFNKVEISLLLNGRSGRDLYVATSLIDTAFYTILASRTTVNYILASRVFRKRARYVTLDEYIRERHC
jgi:hypothetical protein